MRASVLGPGQGNYPPPRFCECNSRPGQGCCPACLSKTLFCIAFPAASNTRTHRCYNSNYSIAGCFFPFWKHSIIVIVGYCTFFSWLEGEMKRISLLFFVRGGGGIEKSVTTRNSIMANLRKSQIPNRERTYFWGRKEIKNETGWEFFNRFEFCLSPNLCSIKPYWFLLVVEIISAINQIHQ